MTSSIPPRSSRLLELIEPELGGTDPVERRQMPHQHEEYSLVPGGGVDGGHVGRRLHHAQGPGIAPRRRAHRTQRMLAERPARLAPPHRVHRLLDRPRELQRRFAVAFEEMKRHALGGLGSDPGQTPQRVDETADERTQRHRHASLRRAA